MIDCHFTPEQLGRFTLFQLMCFTSKNPPGKSRITSAGEMRQYIAEVEQAEKDWSS
jgi:hypothetical protein